MSWAVSDGVCAVMMVGCVVTVGVGVGVVVGVIAAVTVSGEVVVVVVVVLILDLCSLSGKFRCFKRIGRAGGSCS